jgi:hypothetical protein
LRFTAPDLPPTARTGASASADSLFLALKANIHDWPQLCSRIHSAKPAEGDPRLLRPRSDGPARRLGTRPWGRFFVLPSTAFSLC